MRLFLLPVSTRRTLIYCERVQETYAPGTKPPITERVINRASTTWAGWEKAEKGWQKKLTTYGNQLFKRIPFEEWGLKSLPPATNARIAKLDAEKSKFQCLYPSKFLDGAKITEQLRTIATERQGFHKQRLWWCVIGMPITIPFAAVPVIPNLPFFYLCFRAYSHYRALYGGRFLEHLLKNNLITPSPSTKMDEMYAAGLIHPSIEKTREAEKPPSDSQIEQVVKEVAEQRANHPKDEVMLLQKWNGKLLAEAFSLPEMEIEVERAVEQVEKKLKEANTSPPTSSNETPEQPKTTVIDVTKEKV